MEPAVQSEKPIEHSLARLKDPFKPEEIEFRISQCGEKSDGGIWAQCLAYISARAIQDRLDEVCGPDGWKVSYEFVGTKGVICNLSIQVGNQWITKQDGAEFTDIESFKGGISSALKRAGSAWGMGRYLYGLDTFFANIVSDRNVKNSQYGKLKTGKVFYWTHPELPPWALPKQDTPIHALIAEKPPAVEPKPQGVYSDQKPSVKPQHKAVVAPRSEKMSMIPNKIAPAASGNFDDMGEPPEWCR